MPCILKDDISKLRSAINSNGGVSALRNMTAKERVNFFSKYVDLPGHTETADWLNRQLENKILVPGQMQAAKEWIKKLEKKGKPITNKKAIIDKISNKKDVMSPKGNRRFMDGLAKQVMGFEINREDSKVLFDLSTSINKLKKNLLQARPDYFKLNREQLSKLDGDALRIRKELAEKLVKFQKVYEEINLKAQDIAFKEKGVSGKLIGYAGKVSGNIKSLKASVDFSFLRQLQSTAYVNADAFKTAMRSGYKAWFESDAGIDTMLGDLLTRPNALNGNYHDFGIEVGIKEEAFPESWMSKQLDNYIPRFNLMKRSEASFNIGIQTARAELFDWMWERSNGDAKLLKNQKVGDAINMVTGRGKVPLLVSKDPDQNKLVNNLMFAPKWLASRIELLTDVWYLPHIAKMSPKGIRARAALGNIVMIAALIPLIKGAGWTFDDDDERDFWEFMQDTFEPRSSNFGKIIVGNTRFDLTTGTAGLLTLVSRLYTGKTVTTGGTEKDKNRGEVLFNFLKGKAAPALHTFASVASNSDYFGNDLKWDTPGEITKNIMEFVAPISVSGSYETGRKVYLGEIEGINAAGEVTGVLADIFGIAANTYDTSDRNKGKSSKALMEEHRISVATGKDTISAKMSSNYSIIKQAPNEEEENRRREEFARRLGVAEDALLKTQAFKSASMGERLQMLKDMRKEVHEEYKKDLGIKSKRSKKPKNKLKNSNNADRIK